MAREKGVKNLINVGYGSRVNQHGVRFTASEMKIFRNQVQRLNKKSDAYKDRVRLLKEQSKYGKGSRVKIDPLFSKKSASLQRFKTREQFERYSATLRRQSSKSYTPGRFRTEKENFKEAIRSVFNRSQVLRINTRVNRIPDHILHQAFIKEELVHPGFIYYDPHNEKFNHIMNQLEKIKY